MLPGLLGLPVTTPGGEHLTIRIWQRDLLVTVILLGWLAGLACAWWWFEARHLKAFLRPAFFDAAETGPPMPGGVVQVLHVWQPGCPCNSGHLNYVEDMTRRYAAQGVRFARSGASAAEPASAVLADLPYLSMPDFGSHWPGAPAVAIWDGSGKLVYVGPYSDGVYCTSDSSLIEPVLQALVAGRDVSITRQDTVSCLCEFD